MSSGAIVADHLAVVDGQVLEPRIGGLDEDLRLVAGAAEHALDAEHLVADGVAVAERREHLVDARRARHAGAHADATGRATPAWRPRRTGAARAPPRPAAASRRRRRTSRAAARWRAGRAALPLQPLEHVEVLPLDHRPGVVPAEVLAAVAAEARVQRAVRLERVQRLGELLVALVVQPGVAADALALAARRSGRWRAPACRAPRPRARPSTGSRSTTA